MPIPPEVTIALEGNTPSLVSLTIQAAGSSLQEVKRFAKALATNTRLKSLYLKGPITFDSVGAFKVAKAISKNVSITSLTFYNTDLNCADVRKITDLLRNNSALLHLSFHKNSLDGLPGFGVFVSFLDGNNKLTSLDLSKTNIECLGSRTYGYNDFSSVLSKLALNTTLTWLNLSKNELGNDWAKNLTEVLRKNTTLRDLDLSDNKIGNEGATLFAEVLITNSTLTRLNLKRNDDPRDGISHTGYVALANALRRNHSLTEFPCYPPPFLRQGVNLLLKRNKQLQNANAGAFIRAIFCFINASAQHRLPADLIRLIFQNNDFFNPHTTNIIISHIQLIFQVRTTLSTTQRNEGEWIKQKSQNTINSIFFRFNVTEKVDTPKEDFEIKEKYAATTPSENSWFTNNCSIS